MLRVGSSRRGCAASRGFGIVIGSGAPDLFVVVA